TLSEAPEADLQRHVIDAADPLRDERIAQVNEVLEEIGAGDIPQVLVFNKIDKLDGTAENGTGAVAQPRIDRPGEGYRRVWLSAQNNVGLDLLRTLLGESLELRHVRGELRITPQAARLRARLHELGAVCSEVGDEHGWLLQVDLAEADAQRLYVLPHGESLRPLLDVIEQEVSQAQALNDQILLETRHTPI
nr:hypothetical protein [Lysobacter sp.]